MIWILLEILGAAIATAAAVLGSEENKGDKKK